MSFKPPRGAIPLLEHQSPEDIPPLPRDERGSYLLVPEVNLIYRWIDGAELSVAEIDQLVELLRRSFNGGPSWFHYGVEPADHFRWKLIDSPGGGRASVQRTLDGDDEDPLGMSMTHRQYYTIGGERRVVLQSSDAARDPSAQGRGIETVMGGLRDMTGQAFSDDFSVDWAVVHPIWDHLRDRNTAPGIHELSNRLITYAKPLSWSGLRRRRPARPEQAGQSRTRDEIRGYRRKVGAKQVTGLLVAQLRAAVHRVRAPRPMHGEWRIDTVGAFGPEADVFWAQAATQFDFVHVRDREYLNWRFCDRRAGPFEVRVARSGDEMLGFAAIRADGREAVLADLLALPGRVDVAEALLDDAIAVAHRAGSPTIRLWLQQRHPYANAVRARGFFDTDQRLRMNIRRRHPDAPELPFAFDPNARVHATVADSDHI